MESVPLLTDGLFWSIHASAEAGTVAVAPQAGGAWTVQLRAAGVASRLPAASRARTRKVCEPALRLVYVRGEVQAA
jgi:hypothetical protein